MSDKKRGCFYGLAIGDALGAAVEFKQPGEFEPVINYRGFGPHGLDAGQWTDDTSMALALADSLANGFDPKDQLTKYLNWFQNGEYSVNGQCFDIGNTVRQALYDFELHGTLIGSSEPESSGNGSIMRLAPVVVKYCSDNNLISYLADSSSTTHNSEQCRSACIILGRMLEALILETPKNEVLNKEFFGQNEENTELIVEIIDEVPTYCSELIRNIISNETYKIGKDIVGSGWVVKSLEAALWAFYNSNSFEETVLKAVNLGNDSDTTGAVAGQLAGAYYGYENIPKHLIDGLARKDMIDLYLNPIL